MKRLAFWLTLGLFLILGTAVGWSKTECLRGHLRDFRCVST
jgi:hypothetical protein